MTELARSPRRIEHVRENSDKLFRDLFANCGNSSQKAVLDDTGYPRVPWKDRKLPPSFFHPPNNDAIDSQSPVNAHYAGISHAYSRSTPAINFAPVRSMYSRPQPTANLFGPSTLPVAPNSSVPLQSEFVTSESVKEMNPVPVAPDPYLQNTYSSYDQRSQYFTQPQGTYHISHTRQASLPYPNPRMTATVNHRFTPSLKQQQSKPASDWWTPVNQPVNQQYSAPNVTAASVGPACQHWPAAPQGQWQGQAPDQHSQEANVFQQSNNRSLPVAPQSYTEWPNTSNVSTTTSWPQSTAAPTSTSEVLSSENCIQPQQPEILDDQRQQLLFFAARLKEERDRMKAKIDELEKKLEDVMAALTMSSSSNQTNGFYSGGSVSSNPDDLVPSLQIGDQNNTLVAPHLENGNSPVAWM